MRYKIMTAALAVLCCCACSPKDIRRAANPTAPDPDAVRLIQAVVGTYGRMNSLSITLEERIYGVQKWHKAADGRLVIDGWERHPTVLTTRFIYRRPDRALVITEKARGGRTYRTSRVLYNGKRIIGQHIFPSSRVSRRYEKVNAPVSPDDAIRKMAGEADASELTIFLLPLLAGSDSGFDHRSAAFVWLLPRHPEVGKDHHAVVLFHPQIPVTSTFFIGKKDNLVHRVHRQYAGDDPDDYMDDVVSSSDIRVNLRLPDSVFDPAMFFNSPAR